MRLYVPTTLDRLRDHVAAGRIPVDEHVVAESESEEDEYAAMQAAADLSADLLGGPGRRVVLVAETAEPAPFGLDELVAVHADTETVAPAEDDLPELAWYAVQELGDLLG